MESANNKEFIVLKREDFDEKYQYLKGTPMIKQYLDIKFKYQDSFVLFRMGDFYELFFEDAVAVSRVLNIVLAKRGKHADKLLPMCGMPHHSISAYIKRLLKEEYKLVICDQMESPEEARKRGVKSVVKREVTQIITPGTVMSEDIINTKKNNYICAVNLSANKSDISYIDVTTGEGYILSVESKNEIIEEINKIDPREILIAEKEYSNFVSYSKKKIITPIVDTCFAVNKCKRIIEEFYKLHSISSIKNMDNGKIQSFGVLLEYICNTQKKYTPEILLPKLVNLHKSINLDLTTIKNLEVFRTVEGRYQGSIISIINKTVTKKGSRLLHNYLLYPLKDLKELQQRQHIISLFYGNQSLMENMRILLQDIKDLELLLNRISGNRSNAGDLIMLKRTIMNYNRIQDIITRIVGLDTSYNEVVYSISSLDDLYSIMSDAVSEDDDMIIKSGYHTKLDDLRELRDNQNKVLTQLKLKYSKLTGVDNVKIARNNIVGMYIEITNRNAEPFSHNPIFIHLQNTSTAARFTTKELQEIEYAINNAKVQIDDLELELFHQICNKVMCNSKIIREMSDIIGKIDVFSALAYLAYNNNYVKPHLVLESDFEVQGGRHAVIEKLNLGGDFIKNDCKLSDEYLWLITGPNMSGKSTFLRQNAIIVLLAQIGSFVPADYARIGIADQIFTRIGASDNLSSGSSTFMVEMQELSHILSQATKSSFIILDEVGRGTSTKDGLAIAYAVVEYIHDKIVARSLFATHYHELSDMSLPSLGHYTSHIIEEEDKVLFGRKIIEGVASKSYGIYVAHLAGIKNEILSKARVFLEKLEKKTESYYHTKNDTQDDKTHATESIENKTDSLNNKKFLNLDKILTNLDPNQLTPKQALDMIYKLIEVYNG